MNRGLSGKRASPGFTGLEQKPPPIITASMICGSFFASLMANVVENDSAIMTVLGSGGWALSSNARYEQSQLNS